MELIERFLGYVAFDTQSSEKSGTHPSTPGQAILARHLANELASLGASGVTVAEGSYVYATIPASPSRAGEPAIGFLAHMDTSPDAPGRDVKPRRVVYDGGILPLGNSGRVLSPDVFPELRSLAGKELIVTDGTTLLGADDKLGLAILVTLAETLLAPDAPAHREIRLCFTPDEEIGEGTRGFDPALFGAKEAYTFDGGAVDAVEAANFNAASATVSFNGVSVHPGSAKNIMVNAVKLAMEFLAAIPEGEAPEHTEGREGFYHPTSMTGSTSRAVLEFILRDHDASILEGRKRFLVDLAAKMNAKYGGGKVVVETADQYRNMEEKMAEVPHLVEAAKAAVRSVGLEPRLVAIRGGTDGANLAQMGIPCPNLGTGGRNYHGESEYAIVEEVEKAYRIALFLACAK